MDEFYNSMNQEEQRIHTIVNQNKAMIELTEEQNNSHKMVTVCNTCKSDQDETSLSRYRQISWSGLSVV